MKPCLDNLVVDRYAAIVPETSDAILFSTLVTNGKGAHLRAFLTTQSAAEDLIPSGWTIVYRFNYYDDITIIACDETEYCWLSIIKRKDQNSLVVQLVHESADGHEILQAVFEGLSASAEPIEETEGTVNAHFWCMGGNGPVQYDKRIGVPTWDEIRNNYAEDARRALDGLAGLREEDIDPSLGRLAILHGPPGTGKTTLIRAFAAQWRDWSEMHYVTDAEKFFGHSSYMIHVLLTSSTRWKFIVVEDAEEFLRIDAKEHVGQSLARLLNLTDGIVGQGTKVVVLLTTNAPLASLHPALIRPGRCLAKIEVPTLSTTEATRWLGQNTQAGTLADMFERRRELKQLNSGKEQHVGTYL